jgi:hypothetical protein
MTIDTLEAIQAGGTTQWIWVRGAEAANPGLLLIQQGPGLPMINEASRFELRAAMAPPWAAISSRGTGSDRGQQPRSAAARTSSTVTEKDQEADMRDRQFLARTRRSPAQIPSRRSASAQHRLAEMIGRLLLSGDVSG